MQDLREKLSELNEEIAEKKTYAQKRWHAFEKARDEFAATGSKSTTSPLFKVSETLHAEYAVASAELKALEDRRDDIFRQFSNNPTSTASGGGASSIAGKSAGTRVAESFLAQEIVRSGALYSQNTPIKGKLAEIPRNEVKALITGGSNTSGGAFIDSQRVGYVAQPMRKPSILDYVTIGETNSDTVTYARQTTYTNAAAEVAEATTTDTGTKPEATVAFENISETVKTIAHWVPVTRQAFADSPQLRTAVDSVMRYGIQYRLESQLINGTGTGANLTGILSTSGILSQAKGSDSVSDAVHKAITQLRLAEIEPNMVAVHPNDWQVVRLERDGGGSVAGTGAYLYGTPGQSVTPTMWGLPVVVTTAVPDDTAIVGDWSQLALWIREAVQLLVSDSHDDFYVKNLLAILAEGRFASGVLNANAFAKVTSVD